MTVDGSGRTKPIYVPEELHCALKVRAAQLGQKLGVMASKKLSELVIDRSDDQSLLDLQSPKSHPQPVAA